VFRQPRELLQRAGLEVREMAEADVCCGMGGSYALKQPSISLAVLGRKLEHIRSAGAPDVATDCPGCVLQIAGGCDAAAMSVRVRHTAELIAGRLSPAE
jgi:Fe-S oxidoreductase